MPVGRGGGVGMCCVRWLLGEARKRAGPTSTAAALTLVAKELLLEVRGVHGLARLIRLVLQALARARPPEALRAWGSTSVCGPHMPRILRRRAEQRVAGTSPAPRPPANPRCLHAPALGSPPAGHSPHRRGGDPAPASASSCASSSHRSPPPRPPPPRRPRRRR